MRLIDTDALDSIVSQLNKEGRGITRNEYKMLDNILFEFPTIEAEPVRRGKWTVWHHGEDGFSINCSLCFRPVGWPSPYCPQCGAKMEVQEHEEPDINPCRGCSDYDGEGGCKSKGACGSKMEE